MTRAELLLRATRAKTLPVMLAPVAVGTALATGRDWHCVGGDGCVFYYAPTPLYLGWFLLTVLGAALLHLAANVLNDYFDDKSGVDRLARIDRGAIATGSQLIETGQMTTRSMLGLAAVLFAGAAAIGVVLAAARGWPILALGAIGVVLAYGYVGPPLRLGYRGKGLGEVAIFIAFGVLPVVGSFYVQAQVIHSSAFWASIVPGLLTTLVLYHQNFLHWRADKAAGKLTPVAVLEPDRALAVSGAMMVLTYVVLVVQVAVGLFNPFALLGIFTALPLFTAWKRALRDPAPQHYLHLLGATLGASVLTSAALVLGLVAAP